MVTHFRNPFQFLFLFLRINSREFSQWGSILSGRGSYQETLNILRKLCFSFFLILLRALLEQNDFVSQEPITLEQEEMPSGSFFNFDPFLLC